MIRASLPDGTDMRIEEFPEGYVVYREHSTVRVPEEVLTRYLRMNNLMPHHGIIEGVTRIYFHCQYTIVLGSETFALKSPDFAQLLDIAANADVKHLVVPGNPVCIEYAADAIDASILLVAGLADGNWLIVWVE